MPTPTKGKPSTRPRLAALVCATVAATSFASSDNAPAEPRVALELLVGYWDVVEVHFDERGQQIASVKGTEENIWILDRQALQRTYITHSASGDYKAIGTFTVTSEDDQLVGVWFDNVAGSGPRRATATWKPGERTSVYTLAASKDSGGPKYQIIEKFTDEKTRVATTFLVDGNKVSKRLEVTYTRSQPCPDKLRPIFGELSGG